MTNKKRGPGRHSIGVVSRRTGLKPDVIRAWERRYGAIEPARTPTNRRYYTDEQLDRLVLLREATLSGRQIGQVANLETEELRALVAEDQAAIAQLPRPAAPSAQISADSHLASCLAAVEALNGQELQMQLERSSLDLSQPRLLEEVLVPLIHKIGELWESGALRIAHEHMASVVVRSFLTNLQAGFAPSPTAPAIVVCTPSRQSHELGALLVTATAASEGWRVHYLGADCPVEEIAAVTLLKRASAIALSIVYPNDDPFLGSDLRKLRRLVGEEVLLLVGGRSAMGYSDTLEEIAATYTQDIKEVRQQLRLQRSD